MSGQTIRYAAIESFVCALQLRSSVFAMPIAGWRRQDSRPTIQPISWKPYLYGYINQVRSSRRLEREACRNLELIWLLSNLRPGYRTIANFRKENWKALKAANRSFVLLARELGLIGGAVVAIDALFLPWRRQQGERLDAQEACRTDHKAGPGDRGLRQVLEDDDAA